MTNSNEDRSIPYSVRLFLLVALGLNVVAVLCETFARYRLGLKWPYGSPLLDERLLVDQSNYYARLPYLHTLAFFSPRYGPMFGYPAPVAFLYAVFFNLPYRAATFIGVVGLIAITLACALAVSLHRRTKLSASSAWLVSLGALLLSYPLAFEIKQGNMEFFIFCFIAAGLWCFLSGHEHWAASLFAVAAAMKIFPFVYLGLFLSRRRFAPLLTAVVVLAVLSVASLYFVSPSLSASLHGISAGLAQVQQIITLRVIPQTGFDHSAFGCIKLLAHYVKFPDAKLPSLLRVYLACAALVGVTVYFIWIRKLPVLNQVFCLCVASIFLPPVSFDYTLLHLYVPWAMLVFLACRTWAAPPRGMAIAFVCLAILTSIQTEFILRGSVRGGQIKAVVLVILFVVALRNPFKTIEDVEKHSIAAA